MAAWLIGATLDTLTYWPKTWCKGGEQKQAINDKEHETEKQKFERLQRARLNAEVALFRIMICISATTILYWPPAFPDTGLITRFLYSFGVTGVFAACWICSRRVLESKAKQAA
jgi:hypothetical protein